MRTSILGVFLSFLLIGTALGGNLKVIELKDGSVLSGELVSLEGGVYRIESQSLGTIRVEASKVKSINPSSPSFATGSMEAFSPGELQELFVLMVQDKTILDSILSLRDDPDFRKALGDPEIMEAVKNNDLSGLSENPKFLKLMNHGKVQEIIEKLED